jgi:hypothetical protein
MLPWYKKRKGSATVQRINLNRKYQNWSNLSKEVTSLLRKIEAGKIRV